MLFRFTLIHEQLGTKVITEMDGWKECKLKLERDKNFKSLIEYFDGSFIFYGKNGTVDGGIDFIKEAEETYGFDTLIRITIELSIDGFSYEDLFDGQLNLAGAVWMPDNKVQIPIIRDDFWAKFINRLDTPVDVQSTLSLDDQPVDQFDSINLRLTSQKVRTKSEFNQNLFYDLGTDLNPTLPGVTSFFDIHDSTAFQIMLSDVILDEITTNNDIPMAATDVPLDISGIVTSGTPPFPNYTIEYDGDYTIDIVLPFTMKQYQGDTGGGELYKGYRPCAGDLYDNPSFDEYEMFVYLQINNNTPEVLSRSDFGSGVQEWSEFYYNATKNLKSGDTIRLYGQVRGIDILYYYSEDLDLFLLTGLTLLGVDNSTIPWCHKPPLIFTGTPSDALFRITANTTYIDTNTFGFLVHDLGGQICDRITNQNESFHSEILGSSQTVYKQYDSDGCDWGYVLVKGLQIRQYSLIEKPFFLSFNQWWNGINPILCLGLSYEIVDGAQVISVGKLEEYYDSSQVSISISNVRQITRKYDNKVIFKTIKNGYTQWQSEDISGIDDAQTKHTYATIFSKTGEELTLESELIAASLAIETTRRTTRIKSADYKFDNNTFIIAINPDILVSPDIATSPDVQDFYPELDENFTSITNLLNANTRYNSRITPARNLIRWIRYISGCLQAYPDSKFKFVSGEGNYDMVSDMTNVSNGCDNYTAPLSEKQDIPVYNDPLHLAHLYELTIPMEWSKYKAIRDNRKIAIEISQTNTNHVKFFIETLEYELVKGIATIAAWPVDYMDIQVIESGQFMATCTVVEQDCQDAYLTEDDFEYITENGNCLILN